MAGLLRLKGRQEKASQNARGFLNGIENVDEKTLSTNKHDFEQIPPDPYSPIASPPLK
ncbi:hypothetical protein OCA8868_01802 [Octadecabacter ascidiaceicola]|uniref:Uncharacterized protein n=1 Tax=Octadecabacter ascidiaceicola TaxID=1655543 RepID=A0A238K977_9RHOB|nr:hypothetical protein OCA8868_01802 [Octadecabacter ascidiaceicola]